MGSIPANGKRLVLLDNANLSSGGEALDVTDSLPVKYKKIAVDATSYMGLRLCGVDLMVSGDSCWILEINAAPGLDHYVKTGRTQKRLVEDLYLKVLKRMEKGD